MISGGIRLLGVPELPSVLLGRLPVEASVRPVTVVVFTPV